LEVALKRFTEWAGHAVKPEGWVIGPRTALSGLALVGGLALLAAFYLALSSHTALLGRRIQDMEEDYEALVYDNAYLRDQIARQASVDTLMDKALADGYVITGTVLFVPVAPERDPGPDNVLDPP
jgi:hypothetical protein